MEHFDVVVCGAGPTGLACGIELKRRGISAVLIEKGCVVNSLYNYPTNMVFFTTPELLEIGDIPMTSLNDKPVRTEALKYYRRVADHYKLNIRQYQHVSHVSGNDGAFVTHATDVNGCAHEYGSKKVIFSTGYYDVPNMLNVPGENLPKVIHYYKEAHPYYNHDVLVVGAKNSAAIAALELLWAGARVKAGIEPLSAYLRLAASMGSRLDARAWEQIGSALATIEFDERGAAGHDAFAAYARSIVRPAFVQLGWQEKPDETPDVQNLRRTLIARLGAWGDRQVIDEARRRFDAFMQDHSTIAPDDQAVMLSVVGQYANAATFEQLHALAKTAKDESELRRFYSALLNVGDSSLAEQAARIALSPEIPPQAASLRMGLTLILAGNHQALAWSTLTHNTEALFAPFARYAPLISAQQIPPRFWSGVPLPELEAWVRAQVPAGMGANIERGMQTARFKLAEKQALLPAADEFVRSL